jgi:hypothetical protein
VQPYSKISGLTVNPLVKKLNSGASTLVSIRYDSLFRDLTHFALENIRNPKKEEQTA